MFTLGNNVAAVIAVAVVIVTAEVVLSNDPTTNIYVIQSWGQAYM